MADDRINVRVPPAEKQVLQTIADRLTRSLGHRVTLSHVARLAIEDYARRNG